MATLTYISIGFLDDSIPEGWQESECSRYAFGV